MKKSIIVPIAVLSVLLIGFAAHADEQISPLTATASSQYSSYGVSRTVDGSMASFWLGGFYSSPWWIKFDTGRVHFITNVTIYWLENGYAAGNYDILVSNDDANWTEVYSGLRGVVGGDTRAINRNARYIMLKIYSTQGPPMPGIKEFVAYKSVGPVNQPPTAQASADSASGGAPLTVQFMGGGTDPDGSIVSYDWTFGDGGSSGQQNPAHTYDTAGNYTATLIVTDDDGATDSDTVTIDVGEEPSGGSVPHLMRFQGNLGDADGIPLEGTSILNFRFKLYDALNNELWIEDHSGEEVTDGFLDIKLGSGTPILSSLDLLPFDEPYWLGITVESDLEMSPKFELTTVPYSFRAKN